MKNLKKILAASLLAISAGGVCTAQGVQGFVHAQSEAESYVWPSEPEVRQKLDAWQDLKFGVLIHWGLYSVPGIVESWSICSEDVDWIRRYPEGVAYDEYKKWYWGLKDSLNPTQFDPDSWAKMAKDAGMKYMIFTTKHHDGFCMYDSKETDFSIAHGPFADDPRRDVARHVFDAFRKEEFFTGCYFSKPDWHCQWFWNPQFATPARGINYKKQRHPQWWQNYRSFTQRQLTELTSGYGPFDILWLDGGWITGEEIGLDTILIEARKKNPGMLSVDRTIKGRNENYQTPERGIPAHQQLTPWESCITLSNDWGWTPNAPYKSARWVVNTLAEITAKGGCFVLGIGPSGKGTFDKGVADRLEEVGEWMRKYGRAIYGTRPVETYHDGNLWFTGSKDKNTIYAIYALPEDGKMPTSISWEGNKPKRSIKLLPGGKKLKHTVEGNRTTISLPQGMKPESFAFEIK